MRVARRGASNALVSDQSKLTGLIPVGLDLVISNAFCDLGFTPSAAAIDTAGRAGCHRCRSRRTKTLLEALGDVDPLVTRTARSIGKQQVGFDGLISLRGAGGPNRRTRRDREFSVAVRKSETAALRHPVMPVADSLSR